MSECFILITHNMVTVTCVLPVAWLQWIINMTLATNTNLCHIYRSTSFGEQFQPAMVVDVVCRLTKKADCITVTPV